jgi:hypothetical protein
VQGYFAFLSGKRVTYFGRQGDQHTEWFPGAARDFVFVQQWTFHLPACAMT